jgi:hypothetical protein
MLGGIPENTSLLTRKYNGWRACLQVNLKSGELIQRDNMIRGRQGFYPSVIGHRIFVLGGINEKSNECKHFESYNVLSHEWTDLKCSISD